MDLLKSLFSSSVRADVLALLMQRPDEKFYVREVAKLLDKNPSGIKRELDNLEKIGIVVSEKVANLKYFRAEKDSPLFSELKNLITKSIGIAGALKAQLRASGAKAAFIYGPYAEGEDVKTVNLFIVGGERPPDRELREIGKKFGNRIAAIYMDEDEYRQKRKKRDSALRKILSEKRITLIGRV